MFANPLHSIVVCSELIFSAENTFSAMENCSTLTTQFHRCFCGGNITQRTSGRIWKKKLEHHHFFFTIAIIAWAFTMLLNDPYKFHFHAIYVGDDEWMRGTLMKAHSSTVVRCHHRSSISCLFFLFCFNPTNNRRQCWLQVAIRGRNCIIKNSIKVEGWDSFSISDRVSWKRRKKEKKVSFWFVY
jgi:hypothetical protein